MTDNSPFTKYTASDKKLCFKNMFDVNFQCKNDKICFI